jgi:hypothetical protein
MLLLHCATSQLTNLCGHYQMLVGPVMVDAGFGRENHGSILATVFGRRLEPLDVRTRLEL